jgi:hypothetical protein
VCKILPQTSHLVKVFMGVGVAFESALHLEGIYVRRDPNGFHRLRAEVLVYGDIVLLPNLRSLPDSSPFFRTRTQ